MNQILKNSKYVIGLYIRYFTQIYKYFALQNLLKKIAKDRVQVTIIQERSTPHSPGEHVRHGVRRLRIHTH